MHQSCWCNQKSGNLFAMKWTYLLFYYY
uniref:Uncharacterized protein n=1 Tax=Arundo donax TaxID=35708 RepID=A0A0A9CA08_ARUDO